MFATSNSPLAWPLNLHLITSSSHPDTSVSGREVQLARVQFCDSSSESIPRLVLITCHVTVGHFCRFRSEYSRKVAISAAELSAAIMLMMITSSFRLAANRLRKPLADLQLAQFERAKPTATLKAISGQLCDTCNQPADDDDDDRYDKPAHVNFT